MPTNVKLNLLTQSLEMLVLGGFQGQRKSQSTGCLCTSLMYNSIGKATVYRSKFNVI
uniref:Uncharacterized protein n=1 Tax=Glycine max TaxID=3847 RepID=C6TF19_SOYBN|nr:unknown [Glycine max]